MLDNGPRPPDLGGVAGMFAQVYWWLGRPSPLHPQMTQGEVDACEVHVVAMYLGATPPGEDPADVPLTGDFAADSARVNAARIAAAEAAARKARAESEAAD